VRCVVLGVFLCIEVGLLVRSGSSHSRFCSTLACPYTLSHDFTKDIIFPLFLLAAFLWAPRRPPSSEEIRQGVRSAAFPIAVYVAASWAPLVVFLSFKLLPVLGGATFRLPRFGWTSSGIFVRFSEMNWFVMPPEGMFASEACAGRRGLNFLPLWSAAGLDTFPCVSRRASGVTETSRIVSSSSSGYH